MRSPVQHVRLLSAVLCLASSAGAQAVPTATATPTPFQPLRSLPLIDGQLDYALNASEIIQTGYGANSNLYYSTNLSGDVIYNTKNAARPFSAVYAGGVLISNQSSESTTFFQSLTLAQGFNTRGWSFEASDSVSYLPSSPTVGLSGVPGTGDLGSQPVSTGDEPAQDVLATDSSRVSNSVSGQVSRHLDANTSLSGTGSYGILRFLGGYGLDSTQIVAGASLTHQFDARDSGTLSANYSVFSFPGSSSFISKGLTAGFSRRLTRNLTADASAGPLWVSSSASLAIPSRLDVSADAGIAYARNATTLSVHFTRGVNGGSGAQPGALSTGVQAVYGRNFGRGWALGLSQTYFHNSGLSQGGAAINDNPLLSPYFSSGTISSEYSGVQLSRRFTDTLSGFVSYTAQDQSLSNAPGLNSAALSGLSNAFGIGVSFSPRATRLGQF